MRGIDYAWANPKPSPSCLKSNGVGFIMRYFSNDSSKDLTQSELQNANANGIAVGVVWETTANRMLGGKSAGVSDAQAADSRAKSLGMGGIPLYFACDWDASESEQSAINAYLDGVISVIGKSRTGIYGGYWPVKRAFDAGKVTYGWQTYAWSGGNWDSRAQLRQVQNGVTVCGTSSDWDESHASDFGQWPRSGTTPPKPTPPPSGNAPPFPYPSTDYLGKPSPDPHCHSGYYGGPDTSNVQKWQQQMASRGWNIASDGRYGDQSTTVCTQFQQEKGLHVDGLCGPQTWEKSWTAPVT
jgi:peptidoglycan hydrolase-like protein with peptidoglycan-binding domain